MAVVRTVDPGEAMGEAMVELLVAPGCEDLMSKILAALRGGEDIRLDAVASI